MNPSPRVSVCQSGGQYGRQGNCQHLAKKDLWSQVGRKADEVPSPSEHSFWQPMPREISVAWSSTVVCGLGSQQWSGTWLSYTLKVVYSTLLGLLINCLAFLMPSGEFSQGAYGWYMAVLLGTPDGKCAITPGAYLWVVLLCRNDCSDHMCRYLRCVSSGVSVLI